MSLLLALTASLAAAPSLSVRTDIFVDAQAACASGNGSAAAPFCTLQEALAIASADDRIHVAPGSYPGNVNFLVDVTVLGTAGREDTIIDATGLVGAATIAAGVSVSLEGLTLRGASDRGVVVHGDLSLFASEVSDCSNGGLLVSGPSSSLVATDSTIARNTNQLFGAGLKIDPGSDGAVLIRCDVVDNDQGFEGGGVYTEADLTMTECLVEGNTAGVSGAGVMAFTGDLRLDSCLIHGNVAEAFGAGVYARSLASVEIINTTISGNRLMSGFGGGVGAYVDGNASGRIVGCTVTGNTGAPAAGLLHLFSPAVSIEASIVSGNMDTAGASDIVGSASAPIVSAGFNVVGATSFFTSIPSDVVATDPLLAPLASNGGRTMTHAPLSGSPCLGLNGGTTLAVDQRGAARSGSARESGAFELIGDPAFCAGTWNSTGQLAALQCSGDQVAASGRFSLHASAVPEGSFAFFLVSDATQATTPMGSQGLFCLSGSIGRFDRSALQEVMRADASGTIALDVDLNSVPSGTGTRSILAGDTRYFQLWFRDRNPMPTSNFSQAIGVTFE